MSHEDLPSASADSPPPFTAGFEETKTRRPLGAAVTAAVCVAAFVLPGLGHLLMGRWIRGLILSACVLTMFTLGIAMQGELYKPIPVREIREKPFHMLGLFANAGVGLPYAYSVRTGIGTGVMTSQTFDYGWVYLVVCGLLNYLVVLDAFDIARARKP